MGYLKEVLKINKIKIFLTSLLFLFLIEIKYVGIMLLKTTAEVYRWVYIPPFLLLKKFIRFIAWIIYQIKKDPQLFLSMTSQISAPAYLLNPFIVVLETILSSIIIYIIVSFIVHYYNKIKLRYPKIGLFFGFFRKKLKIIFIILGIGLIISLLINLTNTSNKNILTIIPDILYFEDRDVIDYLFTSPGLFYHKVSSLIAAGFYWYIILSIIFYIKNRKSTPNYKMPRANN